MSRNEDGVEPVQLRFYAGMVELVYTPALGAGPFTGLRVRVSLPALFQDE